MTLYSLARAYGVPLPDLMRANGITDPTTIPEGTAILIPNVTRPLLAPPPRPAPSPTAAPSRLVAPSLPGLAWPLRGAITSGFGLRGRRAHHEGVDIDGDRGDAILAAASGIVTEAGTDHEYGRMVVIDHGHGLSTLYAHADRLLVKPGQPVRQGQEIARVGRTGNARGTHLHFEVRCEGHAVNPMPFLESGLRKAKAPRPSGTPRKASQAAVLPH